MKVSKTTGAGVLAGITMIIDGISEGDWLKVATGVAIVFLGIFAADTKPKT